MTVVMAGRGKDPKKDCNALLADTTVGTPDQVTKETRFDRSEKDKIRLLFGKTYFTIVGQETFLDAIGLLTEWLDPKRPNLRDANVFDAILTGVERLHVLNDFTAQPEPITLVVANPTEVFYWESKYEATSGTYARPNGPTFVDAGAAVVFWFGQPLQFREQFPSGLAPVPAMAATVEAIEAKACEQGLPVKYDLRFKEKRYSSVVIPHDTGREILREHPFNNYTELVARFCGRPDLAIDPEFLKFPFARR